MNYRYNLRAKGYSQYFLLVAAIIITNIISGCKKEESVPSSPLSVGVNNQPAPGEIFLAPYTSGASTGNLYVLDQNGNIIKSKETDGVAMNFRKWLINGQPRYTYLVEDKAGYHIPGYGAYVPGYYVISDTLFNEIDRVYLLPHGNISTAQQTLLDAHDFILLADDHYITMCYYEKYVSNIPQHLNPASSVRVVSPVIQEVKGNMVIWQWDGTDYPELFENSVEGNDYQNVNDIQDYAHMNSLSIDPDDNNIICSFRNMDQVLKISRSNGSIIWKLGGNNSDFPLTSDQQFLRQHHATCVDGKLLLFDNGHIDQRSNTRILEFELNESNKTVQAFKAFTVPGDFAQYMGSVQKKGEVYFIGGGSAGYVLEVNASTGSVIFEMKQTSNSYRAFKYYY